MDQNLWLSEVSPEAVYYVFEWQRFWHLRSLASTAAVHMKVKHPVCILRPTDTLIGRVTLGLLNMKHKTDEFYINNKGKK